VHVNWHEANAYCRYAARRLRGSRGIRRDVFRRRRQAALSLGDATTAPGQLGFERPPVGGFADGDSFAGCRQMLGNIWEWTSSTFAPYPGFVCDPYREYSEPWFGTRKVLRGGSFATPARLVHNTWRNFYTPDRHDIFAGFRTCAIE
jgi:iron(II)-dependent oxidoreductase